MIDGTVDGMLDQIVDLGARVQRCPPTTVPAWSRIPVMTTPPTLRKPARRSGVRPARRHVASWHIALFVAALGFVLRALVPAGFMPDAHALQAGHIELTLCSPGKMSKSVTMDWSDADSTAPAFFGSAGSIAAPAHPDESLAATDCPFSLMTAQGIITPPGVAVVAVAASFSPAAPVAPVASPSVPADGPPLGSRAPPAVA
jgi:hypothetical protein